MITPFSGARRRYQRRLFQRRTRRRVDTAPAGVPLAGTGGEDVAETEVRAISRVLHMPSAKFVLRSALLNVSSDASGDIFNAYSATDPSHTDDAFSTATNWTPLSTIYDLFKPEEVILEWFPLLPNNSSGTNPTAPMVVGFDPDSTPGGAVPTSEDQVLQYENARVFDIFRRWRYRIKIPKRDGVSVDGWLDVAAPTGQQASLMLACDQLAASTAYGRLCITLVTRFKSSR